MSTNPIDYRVARFMADLAEALEAIPPCKVEYGEYFVGRIPILFDGDETGFAVAPNEFGGYSIETGLPIKAQQETSA